MDQTKARPPGRGGPGVVRDTEKGSAENASGRSLAHKPAHVISLHPPGTLIWRRAAGLTTWADHAGDLGTYMDGWAA